MPPTPVEDTEPLLLSVNGGTVERVGVCAEGDNCPRYHCRACGDYWLLDPRHACRAGRPSRQDLEQTIAKWVDEEMTRGDDLETSAAKVLGRVKEAGLGEPLLDAFGDELIAQVWRQQQAWQPRASASVLRASNGVHHPQSRPRGVPQPTAHRVRVE